MHSCRIRPFIGPDVAGQAVRGQHRGGHPLDLGTPDHAPLVTRIRLTVPPLFDMVTPMPYVALQTMFDEAAAWGSSAYEKTVYVADLSDPVIEAVTEHIPRKSAPMSGMLPYPLDEAYRQVGEQDTAFSGGRSPRLGVFIAGMAPDPGVLVADRTWAQNFWEVLKRLGFRKPVQQIADLLLAA